MSGAGGRGTVAAPLRAAVIGVGNIGALHAQYYHQDPRTELVGVVDTDAARAKEVATRLGTRAFPDAATLAAATAPEIASIATPEQHRSAPALTLASAGAHLLLEKPLAPTMEEATAQVRDLRATGVTLMVNFTLRSDARYLAVREAVRSGRLGTVRSMSARRVGTARGAEILGPWTDLLISTAIHDLDVTGWIIGAPVVRLHAEAIAGRSAEWGHEDAIVMTLRFADGAIGLMETSWVLPSTVPDLLSAGLRVVGTGGRAIIEGSNAGLTIADADGYSHPDLINWPLGRSGLEGSLAASIGHFVTSVCEGTPPVMSPEEALRAQAVVIAAKRSIATGLPADVEDPTGLS
jgi:predicted dehydrogenase